MEADERACPYCAETIKVAAVKCRWCGEFLNTGADPTVPAVHGPTVPGAGVESREEYLKRINAAPMGNVPSEPRGTVKPASGEAAIVCPYCQKSGGVTTKKVKQKKGISGGKATAAVLTMGISILGTGLSRKEKATQLHCSRCRMTWTA